MTNKSQNINPAECKSCGLCCKHFTIAYNKNLITGIVKENRDALCLSEIQRFLDLDTDKIYVAEYEDEFTVIFNFPCAHLIEKRGHYRCRIYLRNRPALCEQYPYKPKSCEKYDKPLRVFNNTTSFLGRLEQLKREVNASNNRKVH